MFSLKSLKCFRHVLPVLTSCWLLACSGGSDGHLSDGGASDVGAQGGTAALSSDARSSSADGVMRAGALRFDGLYQHPQSGYMNYLRFYPLVTEKSGNVHGVSATGTAQEVSTWMKTGSTKNFSKGQYDLEGSTIHFVTSDTTNVLPVEYQGEVGVDQLVLQVHGFETDYRAVETYTFVPLDLP